MPRKVSKQFFLGSDATAAWLFLMMVAMLLGLYVQGCRQGKEGFATAPILRSPGRNVFYSPRPIAPNARYPVVLYTRDQFQGEAFALKVGLTKAFELYPIDMSLQPKTKQQWVYKMPDGSVRPRLEMWIRSVRVLPGAAVRLVNMIGGVQTQYVSRDMPVLPSAVQMNTLHFARNGRQTTDHLVVTYARKRISRPVPQTTKDAVVTVESPVVPVVQTAVAPPPPPPVWNPDVSKLGNPVHILPRLAAWGNPPFPDASAEWIWSHSNAHIYEAVSSTNQRNFFKTLPNSTSTPIEATFYGLVDNAGGLVIITHGGASPMVRFSGFGQTFQHDFVIPPGGAIIKVSGWNEHQRTAEGGYTASMNNPAGLRATILDRSSGNVIARTDSSWVWQ